MKKFAKKLKEHLKKKAEFPPVGLLLYGRLCSVKYILWR